MQYVPAWGIVRFEVKVSQQYKIVWHVDVLEIKVWKSFEKYSDIESILLTQGRTVQTDGMVHFSQTSIALRLW